MYQVRMKLIGELPVERFFGTKGLRDKFIDSFESDMQQKGIILKKRFEHPIFVTFWLVKNGNRVGDITFYR